MIYDCFNIIYTNIEITLSNITDLCAYFCAHTHSSSYFMILNDCNNITFKYKATKSEKHISFELRIARV